MIVWIGIDKQRKNWEEDDTKERRERRVTKRNWKEESKNDEGEERERIWRRKCLTKKKKNLDKKGEGETEYRSKREGERGVKAKKSRRTKKMIKDKRRKKKIWYSVIICIVCIVEFQIW